MDNAKEIGKLKAPVRWTRQILRNEQKAKNDFKNDLSKTDQKIGILQSQVEEKDKKLEKLKRKNQEDQKHARYNRTSAHVLLRAEREENKKLACELRSAQVHNGLLIKTLADQRD